MRASRTVSRILPGTRLARFASRFGLIGKTSLEVRKAEGQTVSPVFELISSLPRIPGMTITGRLLVRVRADAKMLSRSGVRRAEMQLVVEKSERASSPTRRECALSRGGARGRKMK